MTTRAPDLDSTQAVPQPTLRGPEPGECEVLLIRHGRSADVVPGSPESADPALHAVGIEQAAALAARLAGKTIHGVRVVADIAGIEERIDIVDIFRRSEEVPAIVNDAIKAGARAIWMQLGVINDPPAAVAEAAGLKVVMNRCPKIELARLRIPPRA